MPDLVAGYCHPGTVRAEFAAALLELVMHGAIDIETILALESGPNISTARNKICDDFLRNRKSPWLLMLDTDMTFTPADIAELLDAADELERPVLGGLCWSLEAGERLPVMYELIQQDGRLTFTRPPVPDDGSVVRVSATGAACLLIHRAALLHVEQTAKDPAAPWFRESAVGAPLALMGEDMTFCLRCSAAGVPVHVHTGVTIGHMKTIRI